MTERQSQVGSGMTAPLKEAFVAENRRGHGTLTFIRGSFQVGPVLIRIRWPHDNSDAPIVRRSLA